jgi:hypothetical protein
LFPSDPVNKIIVQKVKHVNDKPGSTDSNNCVKSERIFKTLYKRNMSVLNKEEKILFLFLQFPLSLFLHLHRQVENDSGSYRDANLIHFVSWIFYINKSDNNLIKFRSFLVR